MFVPALKESRTHSERKLVNLNAENFGGDVVAVFVDDYADGYNDDESYNAQNQMQTVYSSLLCDGNFHIVYSKLFPARLVNVKESENMLDECLCFLYQRML